MILDKETRELSLGEVQMLIESQKDRDYLPPNEYTHALVDLLLEKAIERNLRREVVRDARAKAKAGLEWRGGRHG